MNLATRDIYEWLRKALQLPDGWKVTRLVLDVDEIPTVTITRHVIDADEIERLSEAVGLRLKLGASIETRYQIETDPDADPGDSLNSEWRTFRPQIVQNPTDQIKDV